jgi:transposase-like protein
MGVMGKPTDRRSEMRRVVEEFAASGLTRRAFCSQRGIALTTFDYWRRQLRSTPRLVKVEVARPEEAAQTLTLRLANGRSIEKLWRFDEEELARLIRIAERA